MQSNCKIHTIRFFFPFAFCQYEKIAINLINRKIHFTFIFFLFFLKMFSSKWWLHRRNHIVYMFELSWDNCNSTIARTRCSACWIVYIHIYMFQIGGETKMLMKTKTKTNAKTETGERTCLFTQHSHIDEWFC